MVQRCSNPSRPDFANYGGRGITVCAGWQTFEGFQAWALGQGFDATLTLDRIENDRGYTPDNCRWVTHRDNTRNRRNSRNLYAFGETKTPIEWTVDPRCMVGYKALLDRVNKLGWSAEEAISTPPLTNGYKKNHGVAAATGQRG